MTWRSPGFIPEPAESACPTKVFCERGILDEYWIRPFCFGDHARCVRCQLAETGKPHPDNMRPDGRADDRLPAQEQRLGIRPVPPKGEVPYSNTSCRHLETMKEMSTEMIGESAEKMIHAVVFFSVAGARPRADAGPGGERSI